MQRLAHQAHCLQQAPGHNSTVWHVLAAQAINDEALAVLLLLQGKLQGCSEYIWHSLQLVLSVGSSAGCRMPW
jgi:hypothetical protein